MGGKTYPTDSFRSLYQVLMGVQRTGAVDRQPTGNPIAAIKLTPLEGSATEFQIYENTASTYLCRASDGDVYTSKGSVIDNLLLQFHNYLDGKAVSTD